MREAVAAQVLDPQRELKHVARRNGRRHQDAVALLALGRIAEVDDPVG